MATIAATPLGWLGNYRTNTHVTIGMALKLVGQTGNEVTIAGADGATACTVLGYALESVTGNREVNVGILGAVHAIAAEAFAVDSQLMVADVCGRLCAVGSASGAPVVAVALQAALNIDDQVLVRPVAGAKTA